jgi:hypothetical protein
MERPPSLAGTHPGRCHPDGLDTGFDWTTSRRMSDGVTRHEAPLITVRSNSASASRLAGSLDDHQTLRPTTSRVSQPHGRESGRRYSSHGRGALWSPSGEAPGPRPRQPPHRQVRRDCFAPFAFTRRLGDEVTAFVREESR